MNAKLPLSIYTNYYADLPAESQLVKIREAGFTHCELRAPIPFDDERGLARQAAKFRARAESLGLALSQAHGYWGEYLKPGSAEWKKRIGRFKKEIAVAADLGVSVVVAHPMNQVKIATANPGFGPGAAARLALAHNADFFGSLADALERSGVRIAIENMPGAEYGGASVDELLEILDALRGKSFGICLDTGHLNQAGGDIARFILKAGRRLFATHVHDCLRMPNLDLHIFPLFSSYGGSWIDWGRVRDSLREIGYRGTFNLETPGEGVSAGTPLWMREKKLAFIRECLDRFLNGEKA